MTQAFAVDVGKEQMELGNTKILKYNLLFKSKKQIILDMSNITIDSV